MDWHIKLDIRAVAKARPFVCRSGRVFTPKKTACFERDLKRLLATGFGAPPLEGAVSMVVNFSFVRPKSVKRKFPTTRGDVDNFLKSVLDAGNGVLYLDDSQVVSVLATKEYGSDSISIFISTLD